jgi:hypothetical protein
MKSVAMIICVILSSGLSVSVKAQDTNRITVSFHEVMLAEVLAQLSRQYNIRFSYSEDHVALDKKITLHVNHVSIDTLLEQLAAQAAVDYDHVGDQIVIRKKVSVQVVRGKVVDASSGEPLAFASVRVAGAAVGTATNNDGLFTLTIPPGQEHATLMISYIGYRIYAAPLTAKGETVFKLDVDTQQLAPVEITAKTGASVLHEAILKINQNYDTGRVRYTYFVRDQSALDDEPIGASETTYQAYRGAQSPAPIAQQLKVLQGRRVKDFAKLQSILQTFIRWTGFELGVAGNIIFTADLNIPDSGDAFPSPRFMTQHAFELLGVSLLDGREVYVVDFDQKPGRRKSLYKGKFYIDTETLAFVRIEIGLSPQGIEHARFFNTPKAMAALFGYGKCAVKASTRVINYREVNGTWYPSTIEEYWRADLVKPQRAYYATVEVKGNIVVTDIQSINVIPFTEAERLAARDMRNWEYLYHSPAMEQFNAIQTDLDMNETFQTIDRKNRTRGIDMKFWRRYQPYRSDPTLLVRDSLLSLGRDLTKELSAEVKEFVAEPENNLLKPKYPALNRTLPTPHFMLHYLAPDSASAHAVAMLLEANYDQVLREFNIERLEESVQVELYPSVEHYHFAIGRIDAPESDAGMAVDLNRFRMVSPGNPGGSHTRESLLKGAVHEFAHCVHYQFMERAGRAVLAQVSDRVEAPWLFESIASYVATQYYAPTRFAYIVNKQYPTLQELNDVEANGKVYDLGFVIIEFIKATWGHDVLIALLRTNGDIPATLHIDERSFETQLYQYIAKQIPH